MAIYIYHTYVYSYIVATIGELILSSIDISGVDLYYSRIPYMATIGRKY